MCIRQSHDGTLKCGVVYYVFDVVGDCHQFIFVTNHHAANSAWAADRFERVAMPAHNNKHH